MLKNIRLHLEKDEEKQQELEASLAKSILEAHHKNVNSFDRNIPSLSHYIKQPKLQNYSLFCNKFGEINIVDYGVGRTLYGFHPQQEVLEQVGDFNFHAPHFYLNTANTQTQIKGELDPENFKSSEGYQYYIAQKPAPENIECLVVLGCGLGFHILELMQRKTINCLVIYEPELQYFQCSVLINKWSDIFDLAKQKGTKIFLQIEKDGRNLVDDINELVEHEKISHFFVYKHYNHPVFNSLVKDLRTKSWDELTENGLSFDFTENYLSYLPSWTSSLDVKRYKSCSKNDELFKRNLQAFQHYFPDIHKEYQEYQPKVWLPLQNEQGEINVVKADSLTAWYSNTPKNDCLINYENYNEQPHKDGLVLGYKGTKLAHYIHYQFVTETEELLAQAEDEVGALPENIASIIMFGLGVGYQLESLLANHTVEKLFLCEPNSDFFYASLFAIDWQSIFETVENSNARIYLNVGDDGTHLFRDLLRQFHSIGPYILNNTYFYQSYYNASLNTAIAQLREQLQIVISMGEYFDHAYYGIEHTKEGFRRNIPVLTKNPSSKLSYDDKEVPVFIVGNGPSLDLSIEAIKEWQEQAIIISCGTALQALHRNGITPDFHAEIEQNRSTYDWAVLIGDLEYLKKITLISCNGIHPDTCELYKDVLIAFKEGESSTVSALSVLGQQHFEVLQHAFPTVSNFVSDLIQTIGFNHIYLMGIDLGFVDVKHHHSKSSGYYQVDGRETFSYAEGNNTSLLAPGNFRPSVNTKHEFKISRQIIEQVTHKKSNLQAFYNCSDGAKIHGTSPLHIENLLIMSSQSQKQQTLIKLKSLVFSEQFNKYFIDKYEAKFIHATLKTELHVFKTLVEQEITTKDEAKFLINKQKELLFTSYQNGESLLFYYLYGTVNYANAVLSKLLYSAENPQSLSGGFLQAKQKWQELLQQLFVQLTNEPSFDTSNFYVTQREDLLWKKSIRNRSLTVITDSEKFKKSIEHLVSNRFPFLTINTKKNDYSPDYVICYFSNSKNKFNQENCIATRGSILVKELSYLNQAIDTDMQNNISLLPFFFGRDNILNCEYYMASLAIRVLLAEHKSNLILPKHTANNLIQTDTLACPVLLKTKASKIEFPNFIVVCDPQEISTNIVGVGGTRGKVLQRDLKTKDLIFGQLGSDDFNKKRVILEKFMS